MILPDAIREGLVVVNKGEADSPQHDLFDSSLRKLIRYADPAAWITATAFARALAPVRDAVSAVRQNVGIIVTCDCGPNETMAAVAAVSRTGFSSPLRYPAANPGSLVGVSCIAFGFNGPTLNLTMPPLDGVSPALLAAAGWLGGVAPYVGVATCAREPEGRLLARCLWLTWQDKPGEAPDTLSDVDMTWLASISE